MKQRLFFLLKSLLFWTALFVFAKIVFLIYEFSYTSQIPVSNWFLSLWHGLEMDVAMASYFIMVFSTITSLTFFLKGKSFAKIIQYTNTFFLSVFLLVIVIDFEIYRNWGFHLDATPLQYLKTPKEAAASTPLSIYVVMTTIYGLMLWGSIKIYHKYIIDKLKDAPSYKYYYIPVFLIIGGSMIIPARGGFDVQPMNTSFVYYSNNIYANHIAVNSSWNFLYALDHIDNYDRNYDCLPKAEANKRFETMMQDKGQAPTVLNNERPNVILIILESFTADVMALPDVAPNLIKISKEGLYFENMYSVAGRSDKGLSAILSGYPAHPGDAIIKYSTKVEKIPNIGSVFKDMGYNTSFYYGGDINFANMKSYLNISRFDQVTTKLDFPSKYYGAKWGVHDQYVFQRFFSDIEKQKQPFFNAIYTLSSHEPFDVPETIIDKSEPNSKVLNSLAYTDKYLGKFMDALKSSALWDNTLVILSADHGSNFVKLHNSTSKERYHMPVIWTGGALDTTGIISKYSSQTDIIATLLGQLKQATDDFIFSKNLLSPDVKGFSYFTYRGGCGYIDDDGFQVYDVNSEKFLINTNPNKEAMAGRVYLQKSYNYFLQQ